MSWIPIFLLFAVVLAYESPCDNPKARMNYELSNTHHDMSHIRETNQTINVFIIAHTHDDPGWLATTDQYYVKQVRYILDTVVGALMADPTRKFTYVEQGFFVRWWNEQNDIVKANLRKLVANGQFEFNIGGWVMADEATVTYEDMINQMTLGSKFIYDTFGVRPIVAWDIDPFGHSKEFAHFYADMGFDAFGINRIDYRDKDNRIKNQKLEFIWRGDSSVGSKSDIFTHIMDNHYCSPRECDFQSNSCGECWYRSSDKDFYQSNTDLPTYAVNAETKAQDFVRVVKERAKYYDNGNNLMITWGCDFTFLAAPVSYGSMDRLIKYVNDNEKRFGVHVQYAGFSDYIKAVNKHDRSWPVYEGDFMPYATEADSYWVGYYTSRGRVKGLLRRTGNELAAAELMMSIAKINHYPVDMNDVYKKVLYMRKAQGEVQHHDGITGTEKQAVSNDYNVQLENGSVFVKEAASTVFTHITGKEVSHNLTSILANLKQGHKVGVVMTNTNAWRVPSMMRFIVPHKNFGVYDHAMKPMKSQVMDIPEWSIERRNGTHVLYVEVSVPALGYDTIYISYEPKNSFTEYGTVTNDFTIENDNYLMSFDSEGITTSLRMKATGLVQKFTDKLFHYQGKGSGGGRKSGAYAFVPANDIPKLVNENPKEYKFETVKGPFVEEARLVYRHGYQVIIRMYRTKDTILQKAIEYVFDMGPTDDGHEVVARFQSNSIINKRVMYADANGMEMMRRVYDENKSMKIAGNYYPITNHAYIEDRDALRMGITVDRAHGVCSPFEGMIEVMLKRRTVADDGFGVDEPLKENDQYQQTIWLNFDMKQEFVPSFKKLDFYLNRAPVPLFFLSNTAIPSAYDSLLKKDFPENIQLLNFQSQTNNEREFLVRLHHIYEKGEHPKLSKPIYNMDIEQYFEKLVFGNFVEVGLSGAVSRKQIQSEKMIWRVEGEKTKSYEDNTASINMEPMNFQTMKFRVYVN